MSTPKLFDVHTHTQFAAYDEDRDAVIERALAKNVWIINVGTQRGTSIAAIELAEKYSEGVYATVGLHPIHSEASYHDAKELGDSEIARGFTPLEIPKSHGQNTAHTKNPEQGKSLTGFTSRGEEFDYELYKKLGSYEKVVAVGECGLDYYRLDTDTKEKQTNIFVQQIELAHEIKKPLMIHCRNAFSDLISVLEEKNSLLLPAPGIIHFFSGSIDDAKKLLDLGFSFSFGGVITFARDYDGVVRLIPLERILLETDAPYVTPAPYRGKRNEPAYIIEVAKKIADLKRLSLEEVCGKTLDNARLIFKV